MIQDSDLTPAPHEPASPDPAVAPTQVAAAWWSPYRRFLIPAAALVVVGGVAAGALLLVLKPAGSIEKMVPATVDVSAIANLDPSASQKLNLLRAVHRFPDTSTDQKLSQQLDKALKDTGISFTGDVQPWLGPQVGVTVSVPASGTDAPAAFLAVSRDDAKARAMLAKLQAGSQAKQYTWRDTTYGGVTITVGSPVAGAARPSATPKAGAATSLATPKAGAYAIVDHVVVIASSEALIHEIIDADQGRAARLVDSNDYKATVSKLPSDRLAMVYVNGKSILSHLKDQLTTPLAAGLAGLKGLGDAEAFQGAALALSARPEGVVTDVTVRLDPAKLSSSTKEALIHPGNPKAVISWIPSSSDGFLAFASLNRTIQSALDQAGSQPSVKQATDSVGLTGPQGILPHLTGEFALEAELDQSSFPTGAVIIGTNDANRMRTFLGGILGLAAQGQGSQVKPQISIYRGVSITTIAIPGVGLQNHFLPAFAVLDGMGVLASTPGELKAIIDAHKDKRAIAVDASYTAAARASLPDPSAVFYVDVAKIVKAIQTAPQGSPVGSLHLKTGDNLAPLKGFIVTSASKTDGIVERFVVLVN
jgi:Protein of unknown function (DUF3352)